MSHTGSRDRLESRHTEMHIRIALKTALLAAGGAAAAAAIVGCAGSLGRYESDFPVVIENRSANTIRSEEHTF